MPDQKAIPQLPVFPASESTIIPEKVYDRIWIKEIIIVGPDPNGDVNGEVKMTKYGMFPTGEQDAEGNDIIRAEMWDSSNDIWLRIPNMLETSTTDPDLDMAMQALLAYTYKLGVMNGVIANPNPSPTTTEAPPTTTEAPSGE